MWERSRLEWWLSGNEDPASVAATFLADYGLELPVSHRAALATAEREHLSRPICGAAIFISAAAGAAMIGAPPGAPSPSPAVPDVAIVVYAHTPPGPGSPRQCPGSRGDPARPAPHPPGRWVDTAAARPDRHGPDRGDPGTWEIGPWRASWSEQEHATAVGAVRSAIARGDVYQVNVVGHASAPYAGDPLPALHRVAALPGARHGGVLGGAGWVIASGSPELLVRVHAGAVVTRPIKGTRPATAAGRRELLGSAKERAEHIMIVDLERNDLARVARVGTVEVPELFALRRWCDLWQAESRVVARLDDHVDLAALLRAVCPGGSVTGAPKLAALDQIAALEPVGRGASMGALGWLDARHLELGLTIRTVAADSERLHVWAGGGITWDSDPEAEVAEAAAKSAPVRAALAMTARP